MVKIKSGGAVEKFKDGDKIRTISIHNTGGSFELWINNDSLSYLSPREMILLEAEISTALNKFLNKDRLKDLP